MNHMMRTLVVTLAREISTSKAVVGPPTFHSSDHPIRYYVVPMSSRWKRFAFFDRSALSLPSEVLEDVFFPPGDGDSGGNNENKFNSSSSKTKFIKSSSAATGVGSQLQQQAQTIEGDSYSLSVCRASVPLDAASVAASSAGGALTKEENAVVAMARSASVILSVDSNARQKRRDGGGAAAGGGGEGSGGQPNKGTVTLALFSSRSTDRIHVADLTVRCNPPSEGGGAGVGGGRQRSSTADDDQQQQKGPEPSGGASAGGDATDLDGYRGYFTPFAYGYVKPPKKIEETSTGGGELSRYERTIVTEHIGGAASSAGDDDRTNKKASIVGVSACTVVSSRGSGYAATRNKVSSSSSAAVPDTYLHVATVTSSPSYTGVSVCVDPHLYLTTKSSGSGGGGSSGDLNSSGTTAPPYPPSKFYQPSTKFNVDKYGTPTGAVHPLPGLVAVGTSLGYVLVYGYDAGTATGTGSVGGRRQYGHGGTNRLALILEVSPPPADVVGGVSSVRLVRSGDGAGGGSKSGSDTAGKKRGGGSNEFDKAAASGASGSKAEERTRLYVTYRPVVSSGSISPTTSSPRGDGAPSGAASGVCAYDLGIITSSQLASAATSQSVSVGRPLARYDLDSRGVASSALCDVFSAGVAGATSNGGDSSSSSSTDHYLVARSEGLVTYSVNDKIGSVPIDGSKVCACWVPPPATSGRRRHYFDKESGGESGSGGEDALDVKDEDHPSGGAIAAAAAAAAEAGATHILISTSDPKSGRDAVDVYDTSHKIIAFHALLSPGHRALRAVGVGGIPQSSGSPGYQSGWYTTGPDGTITAPRSSVRGPSNTGVRSSAIVLTSGGSLVALTERPTSNKIALLVQKNLYSAAISLAYADPNQSAVDVAELYRQYAEHLYDRGDFASAMEQYIATIGNLEPGHIILRYLDSAKVPLLVQYLVELRERGMAGREHDELLKTCYAKLGDLESADAITSSGPAAAARSDKDAYREVQGLMTENKPKEALALLCSLAADVAATCIASPGLGPTMVRAAPREVAGIVLALCDGTYSPSGLADAAVGGGDAAAGGESSTSMPPPLLESSISGSGGSGKRFPPHLFTDCFIEQPKLLRLLLSTCRARKCHLSSELKRALLELSLEEWSSARRIGDSVQERRKRAEIMDILTDPHSEGDDGIDPTDALVLVQDVDFAEGITYLYEKLGLSDMLLERLAADGGESARRSMLAMCGTDPDMTAEVLGRLVDISGRSGQVPDGYGSSVVAKGDATAASNDEVLTDLREALFLARAQRPDLPPVRVIRILAGEGTGKFSCSWNVSKPDGPPRGVPLSAALDYVGPVLDGSRTEAARLREDLEEYSKLCGDMEEEIDFLRHGKPKRSERQHEEETVESYLKKLSDDIPNIYKRLTEEAEALNNAEEEESKAERIREEFWRDMSQSKDRFETIARYFAKGLIE